MQKTRNRLPGETSDHFVTELHAKAELCEHGHLEDGIIRLFADD